MAFPLTLTTSADVYGANTAPPLPPRITGVAGSLIPWPRNIKIDNGAPWTHWMDVPLETDVHTGDVWYIPDLTGTSFAVVAWERQRTFGGLNDWKRVYLNRGVPPWPTNNL